MDVVWLTAASKHHKTQSILLTRIIITSSIRDLGVWSLSEGLNNKFIPLIAGNLLSTTINAFDGSVPALLDTPMDLHQLYIKPDLTELNGLFVQHSNIHAMSLTSTSGDYNLAALALERFSQIYPQLGHILHDINWGDNNQDLINIIALLMRNEFLAKGLEKKITSSHGSKDFFKWLYQLGEPILKKLQGISSNQAHLAHLLIKLYELGDIGNAIFMLPAGHIVKIVENQALREGLQRIDQAINPGFNGWIAAMISINAMFGAIPLQLASDVPQIFLCALIAIAEKKSGSFAESQVQQYFPLLGAINDIHCVPCQPASHQPGTPFVLLHLLIYHQPLLSLLNCQHNHEIQQSDVIPFLDLVESIACVYPTQIQNLFQCLVTHPSLIQQIAEQSDNAG